MSYTGKQDFIFSASSLRFISRQCFNPEPTNQSPFSLGVNHRTQALTFCGLSDASSINASLLINSHSLTTHALIMIHLLNANARPSPLALSFGEHPCLFCSPS